jgi:glucose-1-phosphatase
MTIRAVIWDVGGVLVRTEDPEPRASLARQFGLDRYQLEERVFGGESGKNAQLGKIALSQHWANVLMSLNLPPDRLDEFQDAFWGGDRLDWELVDYIRTLRSHYKVGMLSNALADLRQLVTERWKIADAFDDLVISAEQGMMKPDERIYRLALERLEVESQEAVFIDDYTRNIEAARKVNLNAIQFQNPVQARAELEALLEERQ